MLKYFPKKLIIIDKKYLFHNSYCNKKSTTFFFFNKKLQNINNLNFKKPLNFNTWSYYFSKNYGFNKNCLHYFLSYIGVHKDILYTDLDEYTFLYLKSFFKYFYEYFSLSWYLIFLKERSNLLPLFYKGNRYLKKLPSRGQRTHSNYKNSKTRTNTPLYNVFIKRLTNVYKSTNFPTWKQIDSFYFHRF